jgi:hypothetical protein
MAAFVLHPYGKGVSVRGRARILPLWTLSVFPLEFRGIRVA